MLQEWAGICQLTLRLLGRLLREWAAGPRHSSPNRPRLEAGLHDATPAHPALPIPLREHLTICGACAGGGGILEALPELLQLMLKGIHGEAEAGAAGKLLQGDGPTPPQELHLVGELCACVLLKAQRAGRDGRGHGPILRAPQ